MTKNHAQSDLINASHSAPLKIKIQSSRDDVSPFALRNLDFKHSSNAKMSLEHG